MRHPRLVPLEHQRRGNHEIGRAAIARHRDVPHNGHSKQRLDIGIVGLGLKRIPKEDEKVELASRRSSPRSLIAPERAALELDNFEIQLALNNGAGGSGGIEMVGGEGVAVEACPLDEIGFLVVVRH
jgi:hypothetical protein